MKGKDFKPAFPHLVHNKSDEPMEVHGYTVEPDCVIQFGGLSKRDYFAAKAMQGIIASGNLTAQPTMAAENQMIESVSRCAYKYADAMIAEGSK